MLSSVTSSSKWNLFPWDFNCLIVWNFSPHNLQLCFFEDEPMLLISLNLNFNKIMQDNYENLFEFSVPKRKILMPTKSTINASENYCDWPHKLRLGRLFGLKISIHNRLHIHLSCRTQLDGLFRTTIILLGLESSSQRKDGVLMIFKQNRQRDTLDRW